MNTLVPFAAAMHALVAVAGDPPSVNIGTTCRNSANEIIKLFGDTTIATYDTCMKQEKEALDTLKKDWSSYPADHKTQCAQANAYMPSYVEWLTCFEMQRDLKRIRAQEKR
jgi:hypothetical protein